MRNVCLIDVQVSWRQGKINIYIYIYSFTMNENIEEQKKGKYVLIRDGEGNELGGLFYKPLPCFGFGIGWLSFLLGFFFPFAWYFATFLYLTNYYRRDPRERSGLAASAIAALIFTVALLITVLVLLFSGR
ncbi:60S ribosomal protein L18a-like protein isoform X2 [Brassica rapa]|nr:60S ribosomal protein L18a-like protein isoform X2 [Brassica rapa]XP_048594380.1 60S ribosomal protein L18a-like protein isoform X1 [Brassica napus]